MMAFQFSCRKGPCKSGGCASVTDHLKIALPSDDSVVAAWARASVLCLASMLATPSFGAEAFDVVFRGARVIDPETGLDEVRNVGVSGGRIEAVSTAPLQGDIEYDVAGLVLAPGFIDLHSHSQGHETATYQAFDGVTTRLELELGVFPVSSWYESRKDQELLNYGASVGHLAVRQQVQARAAADDNSGLSGDEEELRRIAIPEASHPSFLAALKSALDEGAIGIGSGTQYAPGITRRELLDVYRVAAAANQCVFTHVRYGSLTEPNSTLEAIQEAIANAAISGGCVHVAHINSMAMSATPDMIDVMSAAHRHGIDVSTEIYPWDASNDRIRSVIFDSGWEERWGVGPEDLQSKVTGKRLTRAEFDALRQGVGDDRVLMHMNTEATLAAALKSSLVLVASDAGELRDRFDHPRTAGTHARVLGHFVRESGVITLEEAVRKMSLMPAQRLEEFVPAMRRKGRIQPGADADIVVFDPETVRSGAKYLDAKRYSIGFEHVMVNGVPVVEKGSIVPDVRPGRPVHSRLSTR